MADETNTGLAGTLPYSSISPIPNTEPPATPSLWNERYEQIDANFKALREWIDLYVPLIGGTITGALTLENSLTVTGNTTFSGTVAGGALSITADSAQITAHNGNLTKGTNPIAEQTVSVALSDGTGTDAEAERIGAVQATYATDGRVIVELRAYKPESGSAVYGAIGVGYDASGSVFTYAPTPSLSADDTQIITAYWFNQALRRDALRLDGTNEMSAAIRSSVAPENYADAVAGSVIIESTRDAGALVPLWKYSGSSGGAFLLGGSGDALFITYHPDGAETPAQTLTLLDSGGNFTAPNGVTALSVSADTVTGTGVYAGSEGLTVTGNSALYGSLEVSGAVTINAALTATGNTEIGGSLKAKTITGTSLVTEGTLQVGNTSTLKAVSATDITADSLTLTGNSTVKGSEAVTGSITAGGAVTGTGTVIVKHSSVEKGTAPSANQWAFFSAQDKSDGTDESNRLALFGSRVGKNGSSRAVMLAYRPTAGSKENDSIYIEIDPDGNIVTHAPHPDSEAEGTEIATADWTRAHGGSDYGLGTLAPTVTDTAPAAGELGTGFYTVTGSSTTDPSTAQTAVMHVERLYSTGVSAWQIAPLTDGLYLRIRNGTTWAAWSRLAYANSSQDFTAGAITGTTLKATGAVTFTDTLAVTGAVTLKNALTVEKGAEVKGDLTVGGDVKITGATTATGLITASGGVKGNLTGNADTATQLKTARTIDGVSFNGTANITHFGTCSTAAATAAKVVSLTNFKLATGARVTVYFTYGSTATNATLNVNSTGAKSIYYRGAAVTSGYIIAKSVHTFVYNGSQWVLCGDININTDTQVTQTLTATNGEYPILFAATASKTATSTEAARFASAITINPSTGTITAVTFKGTATQAEALTETLPISKGGTGATTAAQAATNLGIASVPTGTVIWYAGRTVPTGYLICNGAAVSRSTYAALYTAISTIYGSGDGTNTFNVPNLDSRFIEGTSSTSSVGTYMSAGLPNITGYTGGAADDYVSTSGAFYRAGSGCEADNGNWGTFHAYLDASRSSSVYGNSSTVQPPALKLLPLIKF